jgi:hypothetical protein
MLTNLLRTRPALGFALALLVSAFVTLVGVGGAIAGADDSPGTAVFLGFVGAVGVLMLVSFALEALRRGRRPFGHVGTSPDGERATVLPFSGAALASPVVMMVLVLVAGAVGAVVAQGDGSTPWVVICVVLAVGALALLLPVIGGRVRAGGVYLTPQGIEHRRLGTSWRLPWDDVEGVVPQEPVPVLPRPGVRVVRARTAPYAWNGDVRTSDERVLGIETRHLSVDEKTLAFLVASYQQHPELRDQLGTPASLDWKVLDSRS